MLLVASVLSLFDCLLCYCNAKSGIFVLFFKNLDSHVVYLRII